MRQTVPVVDSSSSYPTRNLLPCVLNPLPLLTIGSSPALGQNIFSSLEWFPGLLSSYFPPPASFKNGVSKTGRRISNVVRCRLHLVQQSAEPCAIWTRCLFESSPASRSPLWFLRPLHNAGSCSACRPQRQRTQGESTGRQQRGRRTL